MKKELWVYTALLMLAGFISSCEISDKELGEDLLPPGDNVNLFHDTIIDIHTYPVESTPVITSESGDPGALYLLGNWQDTIVGSAESSVIMQFNNNGAFVNGPNMEIDSLMLFIYVEDYVGNTDEELTITVYEFTERIYIDSSYYSDYDVSGRYDPVPLAEKSFMPGNQDTLDFLITNQQFIDKFLALEDTIYTSKDSIFKDYFNGLYLTATTNAAEGTMARIQPSNDYTLLSIKYANDSTDVDTTAERDFRWSQFSIEEFYAQKINLFEHDFSGTALAGLIDDDSAELPYCYVQGMAGVNTRFSFTDLEAWIEQSPMAINSATLVFDVVPEEESGIYYDDLPARLMVGSVLEDESFQPVYDFVVLASNTSNAAFGGYKAPVSAGMFSDTTYTYRFNMTLHIQSMFDGTKADNDFILKIADGRVNPKISKLWGNLPGNLHRIRLEIVYLKL
jgi:hypothetical protein